MKTKSKKERRIARRNMIAGVLAGVIVATVAGAYAKTTFKKMVAGAPATATDVNQAHQDLADAIDTLQAEITKLKSDPDCPPGYTRDTKATGIVLCKKGSDEMVKAGSFWVDRYEMSIMDSGAYSGGTCNGTGKQYGALWNTSSDDYPTKPGTGFPDSGDWSVPLYACSAKGKQPSTSMTWFQAVLACELAGKRLCSNYQWQVAALGTPDDSTSCNTTTNRREAAGNRSKCVSKWGALDMVGNLWEWVSWWSQAGPVRTSFAVGTSAAPWPSGYGDGKDATWNINGAAHNGKAVVNGLPAVASRGGDFHVGTASGVFAIGLGGPSDWHQYRDTGARCCRQ